MYWIGAMIAFMVLSIYTKRNDGFLFQEDMIPIIVMSFYSWVIVVIAVALCLSKIWKNK